MNLEDLNPDERKLVIQACEKLKVRLEDGREFTRAELHQVRDYINETVAPALLSIQRKIRFELNP